MSDPAASQTAISLTDVRFAWTAGTDILDIPTLSVDPGEKVFLQGPSGSGKSTLLSLIAGVAKPQRGTVTVLGQDMAALSPAGRDSFRAEQMGVIFQLFNLLPYMSLIDNVLLPCRFSPARAARATQKGQSLKAAATDLLDRLGLGDVATAKRGVASLSVGQQQRVAAARALIGAPRLVIADEPTSALDTGSRKAFIDTLLEEVSRTGAALLFVSHDDSLAPYFDRQLSLPDINNAAGAPTL